MWTCAERTRSPVTTSPAAKVMVSEALPVTWALPITWEVPSLNRKDMASKPAGVQEFKKVSGRGRWVGFGFWLWLGFGVGVMGN